MMETTHHTIIPLTEQLRCAKRELALRKAVYGPRVKQGHMTQRQADAELAAQQAIVQTIADLAHGAGQRDLFGGGKGHA